MSVPIVPRPPPLASPARIRRRTAAQLAHRPRLRATVAAWQALAREPDEARARAAIEARLPLLASRLLASPYWVDTLRAVALSPRDLASLDALAHFPTVDRATLAARADAFPALRDDDDIVAVRSSGTTGEPVLVVKDHWDSLAMWAALAFWLERLGLDAALPPRPRVALLDALPGGLEYSVRLRLVGDGRGALHRISLHRGVDAAARLARVRPAVLFADPEGLHWLASDAARAAPTPLVALTSAQRFAPAQRAVLAAVRPTLPVVNYYATTETGPIAWECLRTPERFHVLAPEVWVEAEGGELTVTRLRDSALPLLRYRTGDHGRVEREPASGCACGFHGWSIVELDGRRACRFVRPDHSTVDAWALAWLFKQHGLRAFRLVQRGPRSFRLELADAAAAPALLRDVRAALVRLGWDDDELQVTVEPLSPGASGKPAPFVSERDA